MKLSVLRIFAIGLALTAGAALGEVEVVDFEELPAGTITTEVFGSGGSGPVRIFGLNPRLGEDSNAAVVFDSANPTGEDPDLGSPNESFEIDGEAGPGLGFAGVKGGPYENSVPQGKLLIIAEDLLDFDGDGLVDDPDDMDHRGNLYSFDFSGIGTVAIESVTLVDVESNEGPAWARMFDASGNRIGSVDLPTTGDNGLAIVDFDPISGVSKMTVSLGGSGAISGFKFEAAPLARLPQTASQLPLALLMGVLLVGLGAALRFLR